MRLLGRLYGKILWSGGLVVLLCSFFYGTLGWTQPPKPSGPQNIVWGEKDPPMPHFAPRTQRRRNRSLSDRNKIQKWTRKVRLPRTSFKSLPKAKSRKRFRFDVFKAKRFRRFFRGSRKTQLLFQTDKHVYRPGETVWGRVVEIQVQGNRLFKPEQRAVVRLTGPRGKVLQRLRVGVKSGHASFRFFLPSKAKTGIYRIQYYNLFTRQRQQYPLYVEVPGLYRQSHDVVFLKESYGPGETVQAIMRLRSRKGSRVRESFSVIVRLGGQLLRRWSVVTNRQGEAWIHFTLPSKTKGASGVLMVRGESRGEIVSMVRKIPLLWDKVRVGLFPEGGSSVVGFPSRVYFAVRRGPEHLPLNIQGVVEDQKGRTVVQVHSSLRGMGRFLYTPKPKQRYRLRITKPAGLQRTFPLPQAVSRGLVMQLVDDFHSRKKSLRVVVHSSRSQRVAVVASQDERILAHRLFSLRRGGQLLMLPLTQEQRGIVRVTIFDLWYKKPLAERLLFRKRKTGLRIKVISA